MINIRSLQGENFVLPPSHPTFRQQYWFPQQFANAGQGMPLRATRKGAGRQIDYMDYNGGPQSASNQLQWLDGEGIAPIPGPPLGATGLGGLGAFNAPITTYGAFRARVLEVVQALRETDPNQQIQVIDIQGVGRTATAAALAQELLNEFVPTVGAPALDAPVDAEVLATLAMLDSIEQQARPWYRKSTFLAVASTTLVALSAGASAYHGYKRGGVGSAIGWGLLGALFPIITPAVALAQGFGKRG